MRHRPKRAKDIQVGEMLFGATVTERFEGHYPFLGNYVRFILEDRREVELRWRERAYHEKEFAFDSNEHRRWQPDLREVR